MSDTWFALQTSLTTKEAILEGLHKAGFKKRLPLIKDILTFDVKRQYLYAQGDDSLIKGYAFILIKKDSVKEIVSAVTLAKVGRFFDLDKQGVPRPVPTEEVIKFKQNILSKKDDFEIDQPVHIIEGMLSGLDGHIRKKKKLMVLVEVQLPNRKVAQWVASVDVRAI